MIRSWSTWFGDVVDTPAWAQWELIDLLLVVVVVALVVDVVLLSVQFNNVFFSML